MNIQTIPRSDKVIKRAFIPKLDCFLFLDYKQIEPRLLAYYVATLGDNSICEVFKEGRDIYREFAGTALERTPDSLTDEERQIGKTLVLSIMYGGGVPTIIRQLDCTRITAKTYLNRLHGEWPGVRMLQDELVETLRSRGYIYSLAGRRLHPPKEHVVLNTLIQGGAAELIRRAISKVSQYLTDRQHDSHIVCAVHDELILDCAKTEVLSIIENVVPLMGHSEVEEFVPIEVEVEWSPLTWANKKEFDEREYSLFLRGVWF